MDAMTLNAIVGELGARLDASEHPENASVLVEEFNSLVEEARKVFPDESYIQGFRSVDLPAQDGDTAAGGAETLLERLKMKLGLLKAYVTARVANEKRKTHVY